MDCVGKGDPDVRELVVSYLEQGAVVAATAQAVVDILDGSRPDLGALALMTDGVWVWPTDLAHYVRTYNVALPPEFVDRARSLNWKPPRLDTGELLSIERAMLSG